MSPLTSKLPMELDSVARKPKLKSHLPQDLLLLDEIEDNKYIKKITTTNRNS